MEALVDVGTGVEVLELVEDVEVDVEETAGAAGGGGGRTTGGGGGATVVVDVLGIDELVVEVLVVDDDETTTGSGTVKPCFVYSCSRQLPPQYCELSPMHVMKQSAWLMALVEPGASVFPQKPGISSCVSLEDQRGSNLVGVFWDRCSQAQETEEREKEK